MPRQSTSSRLKGVRRAACQAMSGQVTFFSCIHLFHFVNQIDGREFGTQPIGLHVAQPLSCGDHSEFVCQGETTERRIPMPFRTILLALTSTEGSIRTLRIHDCVSLVSSQAPATSQGADASENLGLPMQRPSFPTRLIRSPLLLCDCTDDIFLVTVCCFLWFNIVPIFSSPFTPSRVF